MKMPPKAPAKAAEPEPEVPLRPLTEDEKRAIFLKKLPDHKAAGEVKEICEGMQQFEKVAQIQTIALRQLNSLATTKDGSAPEKRDLIRKFSGLERVIKALDSHGDDKELYKEAFACLCHLTQTHSTMHKEKFGDTGGIERIVVGMAELKSDQDLQKLGCVALHNLASVSFNCDKIAAASGIERLLDALELYSVLEIQLHACGALQILSVAAENRSRIVAGGGCERIVTAMTRHPLSVELAEHTCGALFNVGCATPALKDKLTASRDAQSVRGALQRAMAQPEATDNTKTYGKLILDALAVN